MSFFSLSLWIVQCQDLCTHGHSPIWKQGCYGLNLRCPHQDPGEVAGVKYYGNLRKGNLIGGRRSLCGFWKVCCWGGSGELEMVCEQANYWNKCTCTHRSFIWGPKFNSPFYSFFVGCASFSVLPLICYFSQLFSFSFFPDVFCLHLFFYLFSFSIFSYSFCTSSTKISMQEKMISWPQVTYFPKNKLKSLQKMALGSHYIFSLEAHSSATFSFVLIFPTKHLHPKTKVPL